jgi:hypothetical protein
VLLTILTKSVKVIRACKFSFAKQTNGNYSLVLPMYWFCFALAELYPAGITASMRTLIADVKVAVKLQSNTLLVANASIVAWDFLFLIGLQHAPH